MRLTKHHGWGNDFLVLLDPAGDQPVDAALARVLCDRRLGVGADGLIRVTAGGAGADVTMELRNADGSRAETSGNGLRCLAQAVVDAGLAAPHFVVGTDAGPRGVEVCPTDQPGVVRVRVEMGHPRLLGGDGEGGDRGGAPDGGDGGGPGARQRVDMGNPHLVVLGPDPATVAVGRLGPQLEAAAPGGTNVEFLAPGPGPDEVTIRIWERGVGETPACGTGACAAAAAAHRWGLVGDRVTVHQPGGSAEVELGPAGAVLRGPAQFVAAIEVAREVAREGARVVGKVPAR